MVYLFNVSFIYTYNPIFFYRKVCFISEGRYRWNIAKVGFKHQCINQSMPCLWWQYAVVTHILTWRKTFFLTKNVCIDLLAIINFDLALYNLIQPTISLEMPVPSQGHYGFHSFPVVDWFCLFIYLWVLTFPLYDCSEFGNFVITLV